MSQLNGWVDDVEEGHILGWAWDPGTPDAHLELAVLIDEVEVGRCRADRYRPDLDHSGIGDGRHAFAFPVPAGAAPGVHDLEIRAVESGRSVPFAREFGELQAAAAPSVLLVPARWAPVGKVPTLADTTEVKGYVDGIDADGVHGWVYSPDDPSLILNVEVRLDDEVISTGRAARSRPDLRAAGIADGNRGFGLHVGPLPAGRHALTVLVTETGAMLPVADGFLVERPGSEVLEVVARQVMLAQEGDAAAAADAPATPAAVVPAPAPSPALESSSMTVAAEAATAAEPAIVAAGPSAVPPPASVAQPDLEPLPQPVAGDDVRSNGAVAAPQQSLAPPPVRDPVVVPAAQQAEVSGRLDGPNGWRFAVPSASHFLSVTGIRPRGDIAASVVHFVRDEAESARDAGAAYLLAVVPAKANVHLERLPEGLPVDPTGSPGALVHAALDELGDVPYVDLQAVLGRARRSAPVYLRTTEELSWAGAHRAATACVSRMAELVQLPLTRPPAPTLGEPVMVAPDPVPDVPLLWSGGALQPGAPTPGEPESEARRLEDTAPGHRTAFALSVLHGPDVPRLLPFLRGTAAGLHAAQAPVGATGRPERGTDLVLRIVREDDLLTQRFGA